MSFPFGTKIDDLERPWVAIWGHVNYSEVIILQVMFQIARTSASLYLGRCEYVSDLCRKYRNCDGCAVHTDRQCWVMLSMNESCESSHNPRVCVCHVLWMMRWLFTCVCLFSITHWKSAVTRRYVKRRLLRSIHCHQHCVRVYVTVYRIHVSVAPCCAFVTTLRWCVRTAKRIVEYLTPPGSRTPRPQLVLCRKSVKFRWCRRHIRRFTASTARRA